MRRLSESDFTSKKQKVFSKKAKRFDRTVVRRSIENINCSLDDVDCDTKSVSRKNVLLVSGDEESIIMKSRLKKLGNKRSSIANWEVTESSTASQDLQKKSDNNTENSVCTNKKRKRKVPPGVTNCVDDENIVTEKKEKSSRKKQRKHLNSASTNVKKNESDVEYAEGDTTVESDEQQPAFEGAIVTIEEVEKAARALLKLIRVTAVKRGRNLFESEAESVHMQINSIRVPRTPTRRIRFSLPHPLVTETSDVCLFVPDLKKGARIDHEPTVMHYRGLLDKHGVTGITQIMPVRQLKDEYSQYEMRRRLCGTYDFFLADGRICGPITPLLGKEFHVKRKLPTPVRLQSKDLKKAIEIALSKTSLTVTPRGDSTLMKIGHTHHSAEQLAENIMCVVEELKTKFPGGWQNIRALSLKTSKSLRVPFYFTLRSSNSVKTPVEKPRRPKAAVPVEDELSTIPGAKVVVLPSGEVIVKKEANSEDSASEVESEGELDEEEEEEDDDDEYAESEKEKDDTKKVSKDAAKTKVKVNSDDDNEDSDSDVEAAEDEYLSGWMQELGESESHNVEMHKTGGDSFVRPTVTESGQKLIAALKPQFFPISNPFDDDADFHPEVICTDSNSTEGCSSLMTSGNEEIVLSSENTVPGTDIGNENEEENIYIEVDEENEPAKKKPRHQEVSVKHKKKTKVGKALNTTKSIKKTKKTHDAKGSEKNKKTKK